MSCMLSPQTYIYLHDNPSAKTAKLNGPTAPKGILYKLTSCVCQPHSNCNISLQECDLTLSFAGPAPHTEQLSASELKKLQRKQKKAQLKAQAAKAAEERSKESKPHGKGGSSEEDRKGDEKEAKFDGAKLLQVRESSGYLFHTHIHPCFHTPILPCAHFPILHNVHAPLVHTSFIVACICILHTCMFVNLQIHTLIPRLPRLTSRWKRPSSS